ncbi:unnamed protein product [Rotaria sp. Silwood1]|nr:unnamed protein product [Rotaria sp. Silwood1]CAF4991526.1 unnamed protein product [Rotaria sp. Silwood1]
MKYFSILICTALDPRWKNFACLQRLSYKNHVEALSLLDKLQAFEAKQLAYSLLQEEFNYLSRGTTVTSPSNLFDRSKEKKIDIFDIMITNNCLSSSNTYDSELLVYESESERHRNENPLEWWSSNKQKYPILSQLAYKYLCTTAISVPSERMFSTTGYLTSDRRSRLTPDNVDILLFLKKIVQKNIYCYF